MAEQQDVYITGNALADWSTEATQTQIHGSLKQIQADGNAMIRFLHHIANGTKVSAKELKNAVNSIKQSTSHDKTSDKKEQAQGSRIVASQQKIASSGRATISAITGLRDDYLDSERKQKKRDGIRDALLDAGYNKDAANKGADRKMQMDLFKKLGATLYGFSTSVKTVVDVIKEGVGESFRERFAMVAEMRQSGLLASMSGAEAGFVEMAHTISATNFTFGEATQFTKQFAKTVGVLGVKSALSFANTVADSRIKNGMGYMEKYALEFGQVSNIAGDYLDSLRIGGQLRGMDDRSMRAGMDDFMSNVAMTSNVLKISMEDAADLMKKALGPDSVALLATLPEEQRKAIDAGFKSVNAQGNPMAETLAKRLAAGSSDAFLHTAEWEEMAATAPGREVLRFVEQMATELETNGTDAFQTAMAQGFPELAERLKEMGKQDGVRIQMLNNPQMLSMMGQIMTASQTYKDADKGIEMGTQQDAEQAQVKSMMQIREALRLSETAMNEHMERYVANLTKLTQSQRAHAESVGLVLASWTKPVGLATDVSTFIERMKLEGISWIFDNAADIVGTDSSRFNAAVASMKGGEIDLTASNNVVDATYLDLESLVKNILDLPLGEQQQQANLLSDRLVTALYSVENVIANNPQIKDNATELAIWEENLNQVIKLLTLLERKFPD